jgi:hypothetical protein
MNERASPLRIRLGVDVQGARGVNTEKDPSAIGPDEFTSLINTRLQGGRIVNRKGLATVNSGGTYSGCPTGGNGGGDGNAGGEVGERLYIVGSDIYFYDSAISATIQKVPYSPAYTIYCGVEHNDSIYLSVYDTGTPQNIVKTFYPVTIGASGSGIAEGSEPVNVMLITAANSMVVGEMVSHYGNLYGIVSSGEVGTTDQKGYVWKYDGTTYSVVDAPEPLGESAFPKVTLVPFNEQLFAFYSGEYDGASAQYAEARLMDTNGSWSQITIPNITDTTYYYVRQGVTYKNTVYIPTVNTYTTDGDTIEVLAYSSGSAMTVARQINVIPAAGSGTRGASLAVFNSYLFYAYRNNDNHVVIGRTDGSSWTDEHKDLTTQFSISTTDSSEPGVFLAVYKNELYAYVNCGFGTDWRLFKSPGTDTTGTWTTVLTLSGAAYSISYDQQIFTA